MRTGLASVRAPGAIDRADRAVRRFLDDSRRGDPDLSDYWDGPAADHSVTVLAALVKADLQRRFDRGERPAVAEYLERFPNLRAQPERVLSLVYEEFCLLEEREGRPDSAEFCERYADWQDSIASQLRYHRAISRVVGSPPKPPPLLAKGEYFEEFLILGELGRGGAGRVYLARDDSLGGREVALKVTPDRGSEASILGKLAHPNIVPVHSVAFPPGTGLRGLCMPYRPGLPLDEMIRRLDPASHPARASSLWEAMTRPRADVHSDVDAPERPEPTVKGAGWRDFPNAGSYEDAVAWVGATLARALQYAHDRGIQHRDVKPGNILLTFRDGPQLLDFNLAHDPSTDRATEAAVRGGTLPYMAPEQIEAFLVPERWAAVDARADVYALGLVLREMITGEAPETPDPRLPMSRAIRGLLARRKELKPDLRRLNPSISYALEAVVGRCLTHDPDGRYPDADALAEDLERFLGRRPLRHAHNPSRRERLAYWTERNTRTLAAVAAVALVASTALTAWVAFSDHPVAAPPGPQSDAEFLRSVMLLDAGRPREALPGFEATARAFPDSPLVDFYHGVTLNALGRPADADAPLARSLGRPNVQNAFVQWADIHPKFKDQAETLGGDLLARAGQPESPAATRELAGHALGLALRGDTKRSDLRHRQEFEAENRGDLEAAEALLNRLILAAGGPDEDPRSAPPWLFKDLLARARVNTSRGRAVAGKLGADSEELRRAERSLRGAWEDIAHALRFVREGDRDRLFELDYVACESRLALSRVVERLDRTNEATEFYDDAARLVGKIRPNPENVKAFADLEQRVQARRRGLKSRREAGLGDGL